MEDLVVQTKKEILVCRDNKGKCRQTVIETVWNEDHYEIHRSSGLYGGKQIVGPVITVIPKAKRDHLAQMELEFKSHVKKYLDKGYKTIQSLGCEDLASFDPDVHLPVQNTNQQGIVKPMLCKVYDPEDKKNNGIKWLCSRKHDGLRVFIYMKDGKLHTSSRGGSNYDIAATYILTDAYIKSLFEKSPNLILDGELYVHGKEWPLKRLSGLARLETLHKDHSQLRFYCYDIADETKTFKERWDFLKSLIVPQNSLLTIVEHVEALNNDEITVLHDKWVMEGYEGLVMRDPNQKYKFGCRDRRMQKRKSYFDKEYEIVGMEEGMRREDFTFIMKTENGQTFNAKPIGTREEKEEYRNNINNLVGKKATIKYFVINEETNIPQQPIFIGIRENL